MANTAIIRLPTDTQAEAEWQITHSDGRRSNGHSTLADLSERLQGLQITVLVPASMVLLTQARVPTTNRQRMRRAIPFALEEQLTEDVEALHFALGPALDEGQIPVAVVKKSHMEAWLEQLEAADIRPHRLLPETLALPWQPGQWTLLADEQRLLLRHSPQAGVELPLDNAEMLLLHALQAAESAPQALNLIDGRPVPATDCAELFAGLELDCRLSQQTPMQTFVEGLSAAKPVLNLLQGGYSRKEQLSRQLRPWIPAAAMLLVWLLVQAGMMLNERFTLVAQEQALTEQIEQLYRSTFPEARKVVNARVQMERHLDALKGGQGEEGFISLMAITAVVLGQTTGLEVTALRYKQEGLGVDMQLDELQTLDTIKARLIEQGLQVEIESASSRNGKVESRMLVRGTAA